MSNVQFDEARELAQYRSRAILGDAATPKMVLWLMKHGLVKNEKVGGNILMIVTVLCFALSIYFFTHVRF